MKIAEITYKGGLRTESVHIRSGSKITTDAPVDNKGKGEAFSPTDLLSTSLGCCMLTVMGIIAERDNINIVGTTVSISKIMANNPRKVAEIVVEMDFPANNYSQKEKKLLENSARTCPVALSLHPDLKQTIVFNYA
jgi:putative redox protein